MCEPGVRLFYGALVPIWVFAALDVVNGHDCTRVEESTTLLENGEEHHITIPRQDELKKGTLNDILSRVAERNRMDKDVLIEMCCVDHGHKIVLAFD